MTAAALDHVIVGAHTLEQGAAFIEEELGVIMQPGGRHLAMGTHNRLLSLGARVYLELIALDPQGEPPAQPRWFGLDEEKTRERLKVKPRLLTWAARTEDIETAVARSALPIGKIHPMTRGSYSWRITIPNDGALVCGGLAPTLLQWHGDAHPADQLEDRGCAVTGMSGTHPQAERIRAALAGLGLAQALTVSEAPHTEFTVTLRGPRGTYTLTS